MPEALTRILTHAAIIVDGNRRWAKNRGLPASFGHKAGFDRLKEITRYAVGDCGIKVLSLYVFSTENFARDAKEVGYLMDLFANNFRTIAEEMNERDCQVLFSGRREGLQQRVLDAMDYMMDLTKDNKTGIVNFCLNYGSHAELTDAMRAIAGEVQNGTLAPADINEQTIESHLYRQLPPVDFMIRTSGEERISNFLLWRSSILPRCSSRISPSSALMKPWPNTPTVTAGWAVTPKRNNHTKISHRFWLICHETCGIFFIGLHILLLGAGIRSRTVGGIIGAGAGVIINGYLVNGNGAVFLRAVGIGFVLILHRRNTSNLIHYIHARVYLAKHGIGVIQVGQPARRGIGGDLLIGIAVISQLLLHGFIHAVWQGCDKIELAVAARHLAALGKGRAERTGIVAQAAVRFQRVGVIGPDGRAAAARSACITALHGKAVLGAPDHRIIIVAAAGQAHKILYRHGGSVRVKHSAHLAKGSGKDGDKIPVRRLGKLAFPAFHCGALRGFMAGFRAGTAAQQQGKSQRRSQHRGMDESFHGHTPLDKNTAINLFTAQRIYSIHRILYHRFGEMNSLTFEEKHGKLDTDKTRGNNKICPFLMTGETDHGR